MSKTLYGDAFILLNYDFVDHGEPDRLHAIFDEAIKCGVKPLKNPHPLNVFKRVLDGLDRDERFEKCYMRYNGFGIRPVRCFGLKELF